MVDSLRQSSFTTGEHLFPLTALDDINEKVRKTKELDKVCGTTPASKKATKKRTSEFPRHRPFQGHSR